MGAHPFVVSATKDITGKGITVTISVSLVPHNPEMVYVITCTPAPAVAGSKVPVAAFVIPVPVQEWKGLQK